MARLLSEDNDCPSYLEITPGSFTQYPGETPQSWQSIQLLLVTGQRQLQLPNKDMVQEDCLLCRTPKDEIESLISLLLKFIDESRDVCVFEPSEPSFELSFMRTRREGITVHAWVDSGNSLTGFYRWDAAGIRFFTNEHHLKSFIKELALEFGLANQP